MKISLMFDCEVSGTREEIDKKEIEIKALVKDRLNLSLEKVDEDILEHDDNGDDDELSDIGAPE